MLTHDEWIARIEAIRAAEEFDGPTLATPVLAVMPISAPRGYRRWPRHLKWCERCDTPFELPGWLAGRLTGRWCSRACQRAATAARVADRLLRAPVACAECGIALTEQQRHRPRPATYCGKSCATVARNRSNRYRRAS